MTIEKTTHQRRFLVQIDPNDLKGVVSHRIKQAYFPIDDPNTETRIRITEGNPVAILLVRTGNGMIRGDRTVALHADAARDIFRALQDKITKTRYFHHEWRIDHFGPPFNNLVVAEIESAEAIEQVVFPPWMRDPIEITDSLSSRGFARIARELDAGERRNPVVSTEFIPQLIPKIVIVGGPCCGKTTTIEMLRKRLGTKLHFVPETATIVIGQVGLTPQPDNPEANRRFQQTIFRVQIAFEQGAYHQAVLEKRYGVVMDRGTVDGCAYLAGGKDEFKILHSTTIEDQYNRYTLPIFLEPVTENIFLEHGKNNPHRREKHYDEIRALGAKTRRAWSMHPNFHIIPFEPSVLSRVLRIEQHIKAITKLD